jgi:hypothetical protein
VYPDWVVEIANEKKLTLEDLDITDKRYWKLKRRLEIKQRNEENEKIE